MTTLRMFRVRGKRVWYFLFAALATILIFKFGRDSEQFGESRLPLREGVTHKTVVEQRVKNVVEDVESVVQDVRTKVEKKVEDVKTRAKEVMQTPVVKVVETPARTPSPNPTVPAYLPDKKPPTDINGIPESNEFLRPSNPEGRLEIPKISLTTTIHWRSQSEFFPIATESLIQLPTGAPVKIPNIQFAFKDETTDAKISREKRQTKVKAEFERAWKGYKLKAWMHDEVSPVSGSFRDPFCGWAATLVDGLDTLFIMGFESDFEDAVRAVGTMDFTTSVRDDIPMFETTIRYLGGLLAAYDVSHHKYKVLLDKAVELADVMMGAFDTPNRMPILYYHWKPAFASQKKQASYNSNTAELGSLSMEFTRLAQLTNEPRYYDAVARITNALYEWQERGTPLDGVFPEGIDASGCNSTVEPSLPKLPSKRPIGNSDAQPHGYQPLEDERAVGKPKDGPTSHEQTSGDIEMQIVPGNPSKAKIIQHDQEPATPLSKRELAAEKVLSLSNDTLAAAAEEEAFDSSTPDLRLDTTTYKSRDDLYGQCRPQGLQPAYASGSSKYSMGGGQDSTYEYFPKQFLLLGGQEPKYSKMYMKTIAAVRKYMLFRPMIPGDEDILFSGMVTKNGNTGSMEPIFPEVEHLTCFIGGMVGMSAKIFGIEGDLEIAKKLTEGCVWAYGAFPSGIMPEGSTVAVCQDKEECHWDDKKYRLLLDPMGEQRDWDVEDYKKQQKQRVLDNKEAARVAYEASLHQADADNNTTAVSAKDAVSQALKADLSVGKPTEDTIGSAKLEKQDPVSLQKRGLEDDLAALQKDQAPGKAVESMPIKSEPRPNNLAQDTISKKPTGSDGSTVPSVAKNDKPAGAADGSDPAYLSREEEVALGRAAEIPQVPTQATFRTVPEVEPDLPLTHKQWTDSMIERDNLPAGFLTIRDHKYILRPEAIESVWYMYRITGDPTWQEKGWRMFEAIIDATSATYGHSAVFDVATPKPMQIDEMESFWLAETLKYFYLLFSTPDVISLDEWVLNTEAHPFRRPGNDVKSVVKNTGREED